MTPLYFICQLSRMNLSLIYNSLTTTIFSLFFCITHYSTHMTCKHIDIN